MLLWCPRSILLLCVSDIHAHLDALRAILATAEKRAFHKLLVAGDVVFPGPQPLETWRRLSAAGAVMVQGVSDKAVATLDPTALVPQNEHQREMLERMKEVRTELGELIEDDEDAPVIDIVGARLRSELLRKKVADLPPREAEIIQMRFGLREDPPMTFTQVGSALGVSRERVRQIEHRALARLRCKELK